MQDWEEIEELKSICREKADRARQAKIEEFARQERNPTTVSQLMAQILEFQNKVNSLSPDTREIREQLRSNPRSWSSFYDSEFQDSATLRFWIAARFAELYEYSGRRFWTSTCSRRIIFYNLQLFKEFGIFLSDIETWYCGWSRTRWWNDKRLVEYIDSSTSLPKVGVEC